MVGTLFHLLACTDWERAQRLGEVRPESLVRQGFVHLSLEHQVLGTANRFFRGRSDLVLLRIDSAQLAAEVRMEEGEPGQLFPHLYGPLPVTAVIATTPMLPDASGGFSEFSPGS
jgi:uncharacterized protein (DUF952 family)